MHLAFFHAPWCQVCHEKAPVVDAIARDAGLPLQAWDIEEPEGKAEYERLRMKQVPTLALIAGERVPFRLIGAMITPENVQHMLAMHGPEVKTAPDRLDGRGRFRIMDGAGASRWPGA